MRDTPEIAAARIEASRARAQLFETLNSLEHPFSHFLQQLTPKHLMSEAWDGAKEKGAVLAEEAVDAVKSRPLAATGVIAAIAMFLAREPLLHLAGRVVGGATGKGKPSKPNKRRTAKTEKQDTEAVE
jgi:hypothetical protein